jgi:hypothetical protein
LKGEFLTYEFKGKVEIKNIHNIEPKFHDFRWKFHNFWTMRDIKIK